jgi:DNA-binding PadR family transcriptional regulator
MRPARDDLTAGEWALLALLDLEPAHGFALARAMAPDGEVGRVWAMRRPLVYRALDTLERMGLVRPVATQPSNAGPRRTIFKPTAEGRRALDEWLQQPVDHVRDARSLLMLKLLFLGKRDDDVAPLLTAQRDRFTQSAERLEAAVDGAEGFERTLLLWRLHNTDAAIRFAEAVLADSAAART